MSADDAASFPSPPDGYKGSLKMNPVTYMHQSGIYISPHHPQQWPSFLPGYGAQLLPVSMQEYGRFMTPPPSSTTPPPVAQPVIKKCVSAQTTSDIGDDSLASRLDPELRVIKEQEEEDSDEATTTMKQLNGPLADSPDEGYVGDSQEGSGTGDTTPKGILRNFKNIQLQSGDVPL
jgi:hypothetical protein